MLTLEHSIVVDLFRGRCRAISDIAVLCPWQSRSYRPQDLPRDNLGGSLMQPLKMTDRQYVSALWANKTCDEM